MSTFLSFRLGYIRQLFKYYFSNICSFNWCDCHNIVSRLSFSFIRPPDFIRTHWYPAHCILIVNLIVAYLTIIVNYNIQIFTAVRNSFALRLLLQNPAILGFAFGKRPGLPLPYFTSCQFFIVPGNRAMVHLSIPVGMQHLQDFHHQSRKGKRRIQHPDPLIPAAASIYLNCLTKILHTPLLFWCIIR